MRGTGQRHGKKSTVPRSFQLSTDGSRATINGQDLSGKNEFRAIFYLVDCGLLCIVHCLHISLTDVFLLYGVFGRWFFAGVGFKSIFKSFYSSTS